jgi:putative tryptophan/tyrosine transport system substrate-binding protein
VISIRSRLGLDWAGGMTALRPTLTGLLILALFAAPLAVEAEQARVYRIGVILQGGPYFVAIDGLRDGLSALGLEEGKQFVLHVRDVKGDLKSVEAAARNLEEQKVDLIYTLATSVTLAAKRATKSVPIVFYVGTEGVVFVRCRRSVPLLPRCFLARSAAVHAA